MATAKIVLRKKLKNGEYRIAIRYAHLNEPAQYINLPFKCKQEQWLKPEQRFRRNKYGYKELNKDLDEIEKRVEEIISRHTLRQKYSFVLFKQEYLSINQKDDRTIKDVFQDKLEELKASNRYGSYITYKGCLTSLEKYTALNIDFGSVDYKFLKGFEQYHLKLGNKPNTIGNYIRSLRALHYEYCKTNNIPQPTIYKQFNVARLKNQTSKRSLSKDQIIEFINYDPKNEPEKKAKYLFLFSFYCRGINLMDMLQLTDGNIADDDLIYFRHKTGKLMKLKLIPEAIEIIEYFKNSSSYLFPYLRKGDILKYRVRSINRYVNEKLEGIGKELNFSFRLSFYGARHSFSELNYKAGVRIEIISQMLGHSDLKTTQVYLRSFSDDEVDEAAETIFNSL